MPQLSRSRYYSAAMPIAGIVYVLVLFATGFNGAVAIIGALLFAVVAAAGSPMRPPANGRQRNRNRGRR